MIRSRRSSRPSVMARTVTKKEPERPSGSPRTEVPSHRRPLGLWCPKQPPRRHVSTTERPGSGSPEGAPATCPPAGSPCGVPARRRGSPAWPTLRWSRRGGASALRLPRPQVRFPVLRPSVVPGAFFALRRSRRFIRSPRVGTSTAWSERRLRSEPARGQPDVSAGQSIYLQVTGLRERVTIPNEM